MSREVQGAGSALHDCSRVSWLPGKHTHCCHSRALSPQIKFQKKIPYASRLVPQPLNWFYLLLVQTLLRAKRD